MDDKKTKKNPGAKKRLLIPKKKRRNIASLIFLVVVAIFIAAYVIVDSYSYVASVAGYRIKTYEYIFHLKQQITRIEQDQGLTNKLAEEKAEFWTKTEGGQNPLETAKNESLKTAKIYEIQIIKANELGLKVGSAEKTKANEDLASIQQEHGLSKSQFEKYAREQTGVKVEQLGKILENLYLIDRFRSEYTRQNYTEPVLTDEDIKAEYEKDPKVYDTIDFSYAVLFKVDASGAPLSGEALDQKLATANEVLKKMQDGGDADSIISQYTEETPDESGQTELGKWSTGYNSDDPSNQPLYDYLFDHEVGDMNVVETDRMIYVVKIEKRTEYDDVKSNIKYYLENMDRVNWYNDRLEQWNLDPQYNIIKNNRVYDPISYK